MINMFDTSKFLVNNRPEPSSKMPPKNQHEWERTQEGAPYPDCIVTYEYRGYDPIQAIESQHRLERGLYEGLRATVTQQNLYLLDISMKRYLDQVEYCVKQDYSSVHEEMATGPIWNQWLGIYGWVVLDFLKQVEDWNKC